MKAPTNQGMEGKVMTIYPSSIKTFFCNVPPGEVIIKNGAYLLRGRKQSIEKEVDIMKHFSRTYTKIELESYLKKHDKAHLVQICNEWCDLMTKEEKVQYPVILGLLIYGEARGEGVIGQIAVGEVVLNRIQKDKENMLEDVCLKPLQFSCFNRGNKSLDDALNLEYHTVHKFCVLAQSIIDQVVVNTKRVLKPDTTIYMTEAAWKRIALRWAQMKEDAWDITKMKPRGQIEKHVFFAE